MVIVNSAGSGPRCGADRRAGAAARKSANSGAARRPHTYTLNRLTNVMTAAIDSAMRTVILAVSRRRGASGNKACY